MLRATRRSPLRSGSRRRRVAGFSTSSRPLPIWLQPGTDLVASFAPFNEVPTPYRVTVDGRRGWFAQCAFESFATTWVFPRQTVQIDAPCPHCGEPLRVVVRDGVLELREPEEIVCYVDLPFRDWSRSWPYM